MIQRYSRKRRGLPSSDDHQNDERAAKRAHLADDNGSSSDDDSENNSEEEVDGKNRAGGALLLRFISKEHGSNHHTWAIAMKKTLAQKYRNLSRFLMASPPQYWTPDAIEEPDPTALGEHVDPFGFRKRDYENKMKVRYQIISDMEQDKYPMFNFILQRMSIESIAQVEATTEYAAARTNCDPLTLWNLIARTHQAGVGGGDADEIFLEVLTAFTTVAQGPEESLKSFKSRMDAALDNMAAVKADLVPTPKQQSIQFTKKLDSGRYGEMQLQAKNASNRKDPRAYAATLTGAYNAALHTEVLNKKGRFVAAETEYGICASVRVVEPIQTTSKTTGRGRRGGRGRGGGVSDTSADKEKIVAATQCAQTKKDFIMKCKLCDQDGHWIQDCPKLQQCKDVLGIELQRATVSFAARSDGPRVPPKRVFAA